MRGSDREWTDAEITGSAVTLLRRAFPSGVSPVEVLALIAILSEEMSMRRTADVVAQLTGDSERPLYNEVCGVVGGQLRADQATLDRVRVRLAAAGYAAWLAATP